MSGETYKYLFPYGKVPPNSRIVIYGIKEVGEEYIKQIIETGYCKIIAAIDRRYEDYDGFIIPVYPVNKLIDLEFDFIVLAFKTNLHIDVIKKQLFEINVPNEKIIFNPHSQEVINLFNDEKEDLAYNKCPVSVMVDLDGGIGDSISKAPVVYYILSSISECKIDLTCVTNKPFVEYLFCQCDRINCITTLKVNPKKYSLALTGMTRSVTVANFYEEVFIGHDDFIKTINKLIEYNNENPLNYDVPNYVYWKRLEYLGLDYYSAKSCNGILKLDKKVIIPLLEEGKEIFLKYNFSNYIVVCGGAGLSSDKKLVSKAWPHSYFEELICMIKEKDNDIQIVQIDASEMSEFKNADINILGEQYGTVAWILKNALLLVSIDGGMVHIASQLGTKCVVLFGPTSEKYLGYGENINIRADVCEPCYGLYSNNYGCAKGLRKPDCMYSLTPKKVFEAISRELSHMKGEV